jgi:hypothetical protein
VRGRDERAGAVGVEAPATFAEVVGMMVRSDWQAVRFAA